MRFHLFVLFIVAVLIARVDHAIASAESKLTQSGAQGHSLESNTAKAKRRLSARSSNESEGEDRVLGLDRLRSIVPGRTKLSKSEQSLTALKNLVGEETGIPSVFEKVGLSQKTTVQGGDIDEKLVLELFKDPALKFWVDRSLKTRDLDPSMRDDLIYKGLTQIAGAEFSQLPAFQKVAKMIELARKSRETRSLANKLEKLQFRVWKTGYKFDSKQAKKWLMQKEGPLPVNAWESGVLRRYSMFLRVSKAKAYLARLRNRLSGLLEVKKN